MKKILKPIEFDNNYIKECYNSVSLELREYIENNVIFEYELNDEGHDIKHVEYVLKRAFELSKGHEINYNMLYVCVMFHDITCHIDRENHEKLSAFRLWRDEWLAKAFTIDQMQIMKDAVEDHRASSENEPRNIYGKILSSADRKVEIRVYLEASMSYDIKSQPLLTKEEVIENSYNFAIRKFGESGYAINKMYVEDAKYKKFLEDLQFLINNKGLYYEIASVIYAEIKNKKTIL